MITMNFMDIVSVGFENYVMAGRIIAVVKLASVPIKKMTKTVSDAGRLIDVTGGRKTKSAVVMDSGFIILSALSPDTIQKRINGT